MSREKKKSRKLSKNNEIPSLVKEVLKDLLIRHWFLGVLSFVAVTSAMFQAKTSHETRKATAGSQDLREQRQQQEIDWQSLRLEMTSLSEADRITNIAKKQLNMVEVNNSNEKVITL